MTILTCFAVHITVILLLIREYKRTSRSIGANTWRGQRKLKVIACILVFIVPFGALALRGKDNILKSKSNEE